MALCMCVCVFVCVSYLAIEQLFGQSGAAASDLPHQLTSWDISSRSPAPPPWSGHLFSVWSLHWKPATKTGKRGSYLHFEDIISSRFACYGSNTYWHILDLRYMKSGRWNSYFPRLQISLHVPYWFLLLKDQTQYNHENGITKSVFPRNLLSPLNWNLLAWEYLGRQRKGAKSKNCTLARLNISRNFRKTENEILGCVRRRKIRSGKNKK